MNIVDSSCWLEYFADSEVGNMVSSVIEDMDSLLVPSITIYEVFKKLLIEKDEDSALVATAHMKQATVIELDADLSIYSAKLGRDNALPLADSIIYATAKKYNCILYTQDKHFKGSEHIRYFEKERK